uniref:Putative ovule protein n=1 Tax=Solanum chacoense TaxID=4108 RepID=A0A0V0IC48_SOLCH
MHSMKLTVKHRNTMTKIKHIGKLISEANSKNQSWEMKDPNNCDCFNAILRFPEHVFGFESAKPKTELKPHFSPSLPLFFESTPIQRNIGIIRDGQILLEFRTYHSKLYF